MVGGTRGASGSDTAAVRRAAGGGFRDLRQHHSLVRRHGDRRDRGLLSASALGDESRAGRRAPARRRFAGPLRLVAHPAPHVRRPGLCRLRRGLCGHGRRLALAHRRRASDGLGPARLGDRGARHGDHRAGAEGVTWPPRHEARRGLERDDLIALRDELFKARMAVVLSDQSHPASHGFVFHPKRAGAELARTGDPILHGFIEPMDLVVRLRQFRNPLGPGAVEEDWTSSWASLNSFTASNAFTTRPRLSWVSVSARTTIATLELVHPLWKTVVE